MNTCFDCKKEIGEEEFRCDKCAPFAIVDTTKKNLPVTGVHTGFKIERSKMPIVNKIMGI